MDTTVQKRDQWRKKREYILASVGNVVGLGNVWRFPYLCFKNGGGAFLVPYCFFAVFCGLPVFLLESAIGQYTQEGAISCWSKLCPLAQGIGYFVIVIQLYSRCYSIILAWALRYLMYCFQDPLPWTTCNNPWNTDRCVGLSTNLTELHRRTANSTSGNLTKSSVSEFWERGMLSMSGGIEEMGTVQWDLLLCLLVIWVACFFCIWKGVRSTGKVVYFTALFPYVMLAVLLVRGLTLPGALQGVIYYLYPDVSRLMDLEVWVEACAQVLFSYSVASGSLITFGSYNKLKNNCCRDSLLLCALNGCTSFTAGFVVFSTLGFTAHKQGVPIDMAVESGPGLAFIAFPQAVAMIPFPQLWAVCFFVMLIFLGLDTLFTGLETIISSAVDLFPAQMRKPRNREILLVSFCTVCFIIQIGLTTQGGMYQFQLIDFYGSNGACMLFGCLSHCVAIGWGFGADRLCDAVEDMTGKRPWVFFKLCWCYFTPLICIVLFICTFMDYQPLASSGAYRFPNWSYHLGQVIGFSSIVAIPLCAIIKIWLTEGTIRQRLKTLLYPVHEPVESRKNKDYLNNVTEMKPL